MCSVSFAVGRWRGAMGKPRVVRLADTICSDSYEDGFDVGAGERAEARKAAVPALTQLRPRKVFQQPYRPAQERW